MALKDRLEAMPVVGTAIQVQQRYKVDAGDQFAAAIGFFGFLSLFPLIALALSVVGFVLADSSAAELASVTRRIQDAIPGFSALLGDGSTSIAQALEGIIENRGSIGAVGFVTLLISGLRVINAAETTMLKIFRIDVLDIPGWKLKLQQVGTLFGLGLVGVLGVAATSIAGVVMQRGLVGPLAVLGPVGGLAVGFVVDTLFFLAAYRIFATAEGPPWRVFVPGAILAGVGWTVLKTVGTTYVSGQVEKSSELYGALGGVIALLLLLYLAGRLYVYGAELSAVRNPPEEDDWDPRDHVEREGEVALPRDEIADRRVLDEEDEVAAELPPDSAATAAPRLGQHEPSPAVSADTSARLATMAPPDDEEHGPRQAAAFVIAVGAVAGLAVATKPWRRS